ncbi:MAG: hypothetical protein JW838_14695 [Spirochaetes bacterium]|nr:hypothetical protein [Spirochaetota bacterium]
MKYVDSIYPFRGQWDVPSRCGLRIIRKGDRDIVVVTELHEENPGTSVTACAESLAEQIVGEFGLDPEKLLYIEQNPDRGSRLEHYRETFDIVHFSREGARFTEPDWERISSGRMEELAGKGTGEPS